jgi:hypothetical protein
LSFYEHFRTFRSSQALPLYLTVTILLDSVRLRTFVLVGLLSTQRLFVGAFIASYTSKVLLLVAENFQKRSLIADAQVRSVRSCSSYQPANSQLVQTTAPEATAGWFNRLFLVWFTPLVLKGWRQPLLPEDLGQIGLDSVSQFKRFELAWAKLSQSSSIPYSQHCGSPFASKFWCLSFPVDVQTCTLSDRIDLL